MLKTIIYVITHEQSGCDVFDTTLTYLMENGSYDIKNASRVIAEDIHRRLHKMHLELNYDNEQTSKTSLVNIPSITDIRNHIENQEGFTVQNKDESLYVSWNADTQELYQSYDNDLWIRTTTYSDEQFDADDILYIPIESFKNIKEDCSEIDRFYQIPSSDETAAIQALNDMQLHQIEGYKSNKDMLIETKDKIIHNNYCNANMKIIKLLTKHPEYDDPKYFHPHAYTHLKILTNNIK